MPFTPYKPSGGFTPYKKATGTPSNVNVPTSHQAAIDFINTGQPTFPQQEPPQIKQSFMDRLTTGFFNTFGGSGGNDINSALNEKNPIKAGTQLASGLASFAVDAATFIPKGIYETGKDFATEIFKPGQSNLSKEIDAGLNTNQDKSGLSQTENLAQGFLAGLSRTAPFLALFGATENLPSNTNSVRGMKPINDSINKTRSNLIEKQADAIDTKLGINKNTKTAINQRKANAATGAKTPGQVLAENKIAFDKNAVESLDEHIVVRQATKQALLKSEAEYGSLDEAAVKAKAGLKLSGTDKIKAEAIIDQELAAYKAQFARKGVTVEGKFKLPLEEIDKVKAGLWKQSFGNKGLLNSDNITKSAQYEFGNAIKELIEDTSKNEFVKQLNRQEGDFINAKKTLDGKDLSKLGKTSLPRQITRKAVGAVIGSSGGPTGALIGAEVADYVGEIISNQNLPITIRQSIINNLMETPEGQGVLQKALELVKQRASQQVTTPQLPPANTIFSPPRTQVETPIKVTPAEPQVYREPKTGKMRRGYKGTSK